MAVAVRARGLALHRHRIVAYKWLTDTPEQATWLESDERAWLSREIKEERQAKKGTSPKHTVAVFTHGPTLLLAFSKFCVLVAFFGVTLWLPQIVRGMGKLTDLETGFVTALPYICAAVGSVLVGRSSDRSGERALHIALPSFIGALGFLAAGVTDNPYIAMVAICVATAGLWISNTVFWTLPTAILAGTPAAAGLALINSVGNLGGFFGPYFTGWIRGATGSFALALAMLGGALALSGVVVLIVGRRLRHGETGAVAGAVR